MQTNNTEQRLEEIEKMLAVQENRIKEFSNKIDEFYLEMVETNIKNLNEIAQIIEMSTENTNQITSLYKNLTSLYGESNEHFNNIYKELAEILNKI